MTGQTLDHYRVLEKLGAGGMGEVYRAQDTRLGRDVALKILPEVFARDPERLARFEREAQVLASLNHPNIAAIYGIEESGGVRFLVLEYVPGTTLQSPVPVAEALDIARQIAEAFEAAHEKGIMHRDLKPANVKVTPEGKVKVLDFGLAKAFAGEPVEGNPAQSPTLSIGATRAGMILGTAAYMSPEQARGAPADWRADIWAFGVVLYEMLAGRRMFGGESVSDTLAAVLKSDPDWTSLPATTPAAIRRLLSRCVTRDRRQRLQAIGEARIVIEEALGSAPAEETAVGTAPSRSRLGLLGAGVAVLLAAAAALTAWMLKPAAPAAPVRKVELPASGLPASFGSPVSISDDGRKLAYVSGNRVWIRDLDQFEPRQVADSEGATRPFWSPDGSFVGYFAGDKLRKVPSAGGASTTLCPLPRQSVDAGGGVWGSDGRIIFATGTSGLLEVSTQGGEARPALETKPESESDFHHPAPLPEGRGVAFIVHRKEGVDTLAVFSGGNRKEILQLPGERLANPAYSPTGHLLFYREVTNPGIWALPFSLAKLEASGEPFLLYAGANYPGVSSDATLAMVRGAETRPAQLVWVNRSGQMEGTIGEPQQYGFFLALAGDERRVAVSVGGVAGDVWVHDTTRGARTRLSFTPGMKNQLTWSPAGDQVAYVTGNNSMIYAVWRKAADGSGEPQKMAQGCFPSFSPDGKFLVYSLWKPPNEWELWRLPLEGEAKPAAIVQGPGWRFAPQVSPDGRYVAHTSNESGRSEVFLTQFPGGQGKWQVSVDGGWWPRWSRSGDRLFYSAPDNSLMEVEVQTRPSMKLGTPRKLFARKVSGVMAVITGWPDAFDVTGDGKRFVFLQPAGSEGAPTTITLVENWFAEFRKK